MPPEYQSSDKFAFISDGTLISRLKQKAKALKKTENTKLHDAQNKVARQHGFPNWSQLSASKLEPIHENDEIVGFWQRLGNYDHEIYIDHLYEEVEAWHDDATAPVIYVKIELDSDEGEKLYISSLHFKSVEVSTNQTRVIKQVKTEDVEAVSEFLEGSMTSGRIMNVLGPIGIFDFDPRELLCL